MKKVKPISKKLFIKDLEKPLPLAAQSGKKGGIAQLAISMLIGEWV